MKSCMVLDALRKANNLNKFLAPEVLIDSEASMGSALRLKKRIAHSTNPGKLLVWDDKECESSDTDSKK